MILQKYFFLGSLGVLTPKTTNLLFVYHHTSSCQTANQHNTDTPDENIIPMLNAFVFNLNSAKKHFDHFRLYEKQCEKTNETRML